MTQFTPKSLVLHQPGNPRRDLSDLTMAAPMPPEQLEYYEEHASDTVQPNLIATIVLGLAVACLAVILRFLARRMNKLPFRADDWLVLLALVQHFSYERNDRVRELC